MRTLPVLLLLAVGPLHYRVVTDCESSSARPRDDAGTDAGAGAPTITSAIINGGAAFTNASLLKFSVSASGEHAPLSVRVAPADGVGDCQSRYADDDWKPYDGGTLDVDVWLTPTDGQKKLCAWVKDANASVSVIQPPTGTEGADMDTVQLDTVGIPIVSSFTVTAAGGGTTFAGGEAVVISFTITDAQALAQAPVELWYSTTSSAEDAWIPIALGVGASGGATSYTGTYTSFPARPGPFRIMLKAVDAAGNRSAAAVSDLLNGGNWSVYAGSRDVGVGGGPFTAMLRHQSNVDGRFAVDPRTHDVYVRNRGVAGDGILRLNARTGLVERVFWDGVLNLPDDGPLPARPSFDGESVMDFDPAGRLYLLPMEGGWDTGVQRTIYQIDLETRWCRRYAGPGAVFDNTATPQTVFVSESPFDFDEDGTLFFLTNCSPGVDDPTSGKRLMKITQNPDGTPGTVSVVAGNCAYANPPSRGPMDAVSSPIGTIYATEIGSITAFGHGRYVYFMALGSGGVWKVLDGQLYASDISLDKEGYGLTYNPADNRIYVSNGGVTAYTPNLTGSDGDVASTFVAGGVAGTPGCWEDGVVATQACVNARFALRMDSDGTVLFMDGRHLNGRGAYLIRYVDSDGMVRTRVGAKPFNAAGVHRRLLQTEFAGIVYKPSSAPNQAAFPEGLYFVNPQAMVLGHLDPATNLAAVDWGDQSGNDVSLPTGTPISSGLSMGVDYGGGSVQSLAFDDNGLPWMRVQQVLNGPSTLFSVDAARRLVARQTSASTYWALAADGTNPATLHLWPYTTMSNLTMKGSQVFLLGGYDGIVSAPVIKLLDFGAGTTKNLMGNTSYSGLTADRLTPGTVSTATLDASCMDYGGCYSQYRADQDRLYFTESTKLRYITQPSTPASSTLVTLWDIGLTIDNWVFSPDGSQVFYARWGGLYCHDLSSGKAWCDDSWLGPPSPLDTMGGANPNQFTWKDASTLLMSTGWGEIYQYVLPP